MAELKVSCVRLELSFVSAPHNEATPELLRNPRTRATVAAA